MNTLPFRLPYPGLRLRHRLILQRIHARQTPDGLLIKLHSRLRVPARRVFGIEGGQAVEEGLAGVHDWARVEGVLALVQGAPVT